MRARRVVSLSDSRLALVDLRIAGRVECAPQLDAARLPATRWRFDAAPCIAQAAQAVAAGASRCGRWVRWRAALMMVGALESALEQSVRYANERVQFGKPIGSNQAIQQQLALMAGDAPPRAWPPLAAAADAPEPRAARRAGGRVQHRGGQGALPARPPTRATGIAHQVHGAIGFTREHALHFATRRLWAWRERVRQRCLLGRAPGPAAIAGGGKRASGRR